MNYRFHLLDSTENFRAAAPLSAPDDKQADHVAAFVGEAIPAFLTATNCGAARIVKD